MNKCLFLKKYYVDIAMSLHDIIISSASTYSETNNDDEIILLYRMYRYMYIHCVKNLGKEITIIILYIAEKMKTYIYMYIRTIIIYSGNYS